MFAWQVLLTIKRADVAVSWVSMVRKNMEKLASWTQLSVWALASLGYYLASGQWFWLWKTRLDKVWVSRYWFPLGWKMRVLHLEHAFLGFFSWSCQLELLDRLCYPFCQGQPKKQQGQVLPWTGLQIPQRHFAQFLCRHSRDAAGMLCCKTTAVNFRDSQQAAGKPHEF